VSDVTRLLCLTIVLLSACQTDATIGSNFRGELDADSLPSCADAVDNDGDALIDYPFDPGCPDPSDDDETGPAVPPECSDSADNDTDMITDFPLEPGCESAGDNDETDPSPLPECSDGDDNDGDGATDYPDDPGCPSAGWWTESTETS
jgi:hypothetical protein